MKAEEPDRTVSYLEALAYQQTVKSIDLLSHSPAKEGEPGWVLMEALASAVIEYERLMWPDSPDSLEHRIAKQRRKPTRKRR